MQEINRANSDCFDEYIPGMENDTYSMFANVQYLLP